MKVVIDRRTWLRGEGGGASFLRRAADGKQCCLGFVALALGQAEADIVDRSTLCNIDRDVRSTNMADLLFYYSPLLFHAMELNDEKDIVLDIRELAIQQALAPLGLDLEFVN